MILACAGFFGFLSDVGAAFIGFLMGVAALFAGKEVHRWIG